MYLVGAVMSQDGESHADVGRVPPEDLLLNAMEQLKGIFHLADVDVITAGLGDGAMDRLQDQLHDLLLEVRDAFLLWIRS